MENERVKAVISLLADESEFVYSHILPEIKEMQLRGEIDLRKIAKEESNPVIVSKIQQIITQYSDLFIADNIRKWRKHGAVNMFHAWLEISKINNPNLDEEYITEQMNRLSHIIWLKVHEERFDLQKLSKLSEVLFDQEGFSISDKKFLNDPKNYYLDELFESKTGNFWSIPMLFKILCDRLNISIFFVNVESFTSLLYKGKFGDVYILASKPPQFFKIDNYKKFLMDLERPEKASYFRPSSNFKIIMQILNNLTVSYRIVDDYKKSEQVQKLINAIFS